MNPLSEVNEGWQQAAEARIRQAIGPLKAAGQPVTVRAIHRITGGSCSTISRVLKEDRRVRLRRLESRPGESVRDLLTRCLDALEKYRRGPTGGGRQRLNV